MPVVLTNRLILNLKASRAAPPTTSSYATRERAAGTQSLNFRSKETATAWSFGAIVDVLGASGRSTASETTLQPEYELDIKLPMSPGPVP
jgi:hypothetical protein